MPAIFMTIAKLVGSTIVSMFMKLMTEAFLKKMFIKALEALVKKTASKEDDKILEAAKKEWSKPKS